MQDSMVELFVKHQIPLCIGIIPFEATHRTQSRLFRSESPAGDSEQHQIKNLIQSGAIEMMMHGFAHTDNNIGGKSKSKYGKSEFAGDNYESQYQRLKSGKGYLDSLFEKDVEVFSPPWNTYDKNTLRALKNLGFKTISSDIAGKSYGISLNYLPFSTEDFGIFEKDKIKNLASYSNADIVVVMFHSYSIGKAGMPNLNYLDSLLSRLKSEDFVFHTYSSYLNKHKAGYFRLYQNSRLHFNPILHKLYPTQTGVFENHPKLFYIFYGTVVLMFLLVLRVFKSYIVLSRKRR